MSDQLNEQEIAAIEAAKAEIERLRSEPGNAETEIAVGRAAQQLPVEVWRLVDSDAVEYLRFYKKIKSDLDRERFGNPVERRAALNAKQVTVIETRPATPARPNLKVPEECGKGGEAGLRAAAGYLERLSNARNRR